MDNHHPTRVQDARKRLREGAVMRRLLKRIRKALAAPAHTQNAVFVVPDSQAETVAETLEEMRSWS